VSLMVSSIVRYIFLTQGEKAIVDDEDYKWLSKYKWQYSRGYAKRDARCIRMHRQILHAPKSLEVDHINGNKLDNRRSNLRLVNHFQQNQNSANRKDNTSGCRGVNFFKPIKKWSVRIQFNGKRVFLGYYRNKSNAIKAYSKASKKYHGDYRRGLDTMI
jgi:hypothetical protein